MVVGTNKSRLQEHSTERLIEFTRRWGLEFNEEILETVTKQSYSHFNFLDNYEEVVGQEVPEEVSDNFLGVIDVLWERHYPEQFCIDYFIRDIKQVQRRFAYHVDEDTIQTIIEDWKDLWDNLKSAINEFSNNELSSHIQASYEITSWLIDSVTFFSKLDESRLKLLKQICDDYLNYICQGEPDDDYKYMKLNYCVTVFQNDFELGNQLLEQLRDEFPEYVVAHLYHFENLVAYYTDEQSLEVLDQEDKDSLEDILLQAKDELTNPDNEIHTEWVFDLLIDFYQETNQQTKLEDIVTKYDQIKSSLPDNKDQSEISEEEDFNNFYGNALIKDPGTIIPIQFICDDCGFGYIENVDEVNVVNTYLRSNNYQDDDKKENGKIIFKQEITCPTCESHDFRLDSIAKTMIMINISHIYEKNLPMTNIRDIQLTFKDEPISNPTEILTVIKKEYLQSPDDPSILTRAGIIYRRFNYYDHAKKSLLKAIKLDPKNSLAYFHLGTIYHGRGNFKKAKLCFKKMKQNSNDWNDFLHDCNIEVRQFIFNKV